MDSTVIIVLGGLAAIAVLAWAAVQIAQIGARGRMRREIMAYVAEGSISPEAAAQLIEMSERADLRRKVLSTADWDSDWDRWRETVREVFGDDFGKPGAAKDGPAPDARPAAGAASS